jgi:putative transposase
MSRGNRGQDIFLAPTDFERFLSMLDRVAARRGWVGHAYCLLPNHYHVVMETSAANLSLGMQWLNGAYAQAFNRIHGYRGHLFQGRFHSVLVESDWHLIELSRYLALNPVRALLCNRPEEWPWSSYASVAGLVRPRPFVAPQRVLQSFGRTPDLARARFVDFVDDAPLLAGHTGPTGPLGHAPGSDPGAWPVGTGQPTP